MELETERLRLRPVTTDDAALLHAIWTDPGVRRYLWDDIEIPRARADEAVAANVADWQSREYGLWLVHLRSSSEPIGFCGLRPAEWCAAPELLFGLLPAHWAQGLATEAACAVLEDAFDRIGLDEIVAAADAPNVASTRVLVRAGMIKERRGSLNGLDSVFFRAARPLRASRQILRKLNPGPPCGGGS
jgi:[ribosomal protein S5]-alanine N-acetyltransferase